MQEVRVVVAEDGYLLRAGIRAVLAELDGFTLVAECSTYDGLLDSVDRVQPDLVLTDIKMPPSFTDEGIRAACLLRERAPDVGVVVLSQYLDAEYALALVRDGSHRRGYLLKERLSDLDQLATALDEVARGGSVIDPLVVDTLMRRPVREHPLARLTQREKEVLEHVARGATNAAISAALFITERAVEKHINSIFAKLELPVDTDVHRRVAAVLVWLGATVGATAVPPGGAAGTERAAPSASPSTQRRVRGANTMGPGR